MMCCRQSRRSLYLIIISMTLVVTVNVLDASSADPGENLLTNANWEGADAGFPDGWTGYNAQSVLDESFFFEPDPDDPGEWVLVIDDQSNTTAYGLVSSSVPAQAGNMYMASASTRADVGGLATVYIQFLNAGGSIVGSQSKHTGGTAWTRSSVHLVAPEETVSARILLYSRGGTVGKSYFRDAKLEIVGSPVGGEESVDWIYVGGKLDTKPYYAERVAHVNNTSELKAAITDAQAGDVIVAKEGAYVGDTPLIIFEKVGSEEKPIVITSEHIGGAEIGGSLELIVTDSSYVVIEGFVFTTTGRGIVIQDSDHIRVTRNHFNLTETYGEETIHDWVRIRGVKAAYNRIDHNLFENKVQNGAYLSISKTPSDTVPTPIHTRVDHNHFRDMAPLGINGMEAVRIGVGSRLYAPFDAHTLFEYNLFERADGEKAEIISIKSSGNVIRYNTIIDTAGGFTLRHGDRNEIYGNYFIGNGKAGARGVRVYGKDNKVYNNYFEGLSTAISLGNGGVEDVSELNIPSISGYVRINRADIAYNTFIDNAQNVVSTGREEDTLTPLNTRIANNVFYSASEQTHVIGFSSYPSIFALDGVTWEGNIAWGPGGALAGMDQMTEEKILVSDPNLVRNIDGLYYIDENSVARNAGTGSYPYVTTDLEGKQRSNTPDMGAFEYGGYPLLRGPLTPADVGPFAVEDLSLWSWNDTLSVHLTDIHIEASAQGDVHVMTVTVDGAVTGDLDANAIRNVGIRARVGDEMIFRGRGLPATFSFDPEQFGAEFTELTIEACIGTSRTNRTVKRNFF